MRTRITSVLLAALAAPGVSCQPELPASADGAESTGSTGPVIRTEPAGPLDAVAASVWFRIRVPGMRPDPQRFVLVEGDLGSGHLDQLERQAPSRALEERIVPTLAWRSADDEVVLAPSRALVHGARYSVAAGEPSFAAAIDVAELDPLPWLELVWPPEGQSAGAPFALWCGDVGLPSLSSSLTLEPGQVKATLADTLAIHGQGRGCVQLTAELSEGPFAATPMVLDSGGSPIASLEPVVLSSGGTDEPVAPPPCALGHIGLGPGCAEVADDRLLLFTPPQPLLWMIADAQPPAALDSVFVSEGVPRWIQPLAPSSSTWLQLLIVDAAGRTERSSALVTTSSPVPHLVLNEVLANTVGPEPEQEWVEIFNDGTVAAPLANWVLADVGGEVVLPDLSLAAGGYALVVNDDYDDSGKYDPAPLPGTLLVRVPKLGKNGLSNEGEPLELIDPEGVVRSQFPQKPKPKSGRSVMRIHPLAPDEDEGSFVLSEEGASTPGGSNSQ